MGYGGVWGGKPQGGGFGGRFPLAIRSSDRRARARTRQSTVLSRALGSASLGPCSLARRASRRDQDTPPAAWLGLSTRSRARAYAPVSDPTRELARSLGKLLSGLLGICLASAQMAPWLLPEGPLDAIRTRHQLLGYNAIGARAYAPVSDPTRELARSLGKLLSGLLGICLASAQMAPWLLPEGPLDAIRTRHQLLG